MSDLSFSSIKVHSLQRFSLNFSANLIASFWLLLGSVKVFDWVKPSISQFASFLLTATLANVLFGWLASEMGSELNPQGLISYLVWPVIMLLAGEVLARRSDNNALVFMPAVLWLTADTVLALAQSLIQFLVLQNLLPEWGYDVSPMLFLVLFVWQTVALLLVFAKKLQWSWAERALMGIGAVFLLSVWQKNVESQPIFKLQTRTPIISEQDFYAQSALLSDTLAGISKGNLGTSEWYFLGVAGFAEQNVFASEIDEALGLFEKRFNALGHTATLVNNIHTWQDSPVASKSSIAKVLNKIGEQMNNEEDVLFLTISTHGMVDETNTPTGELMLANPPLVLDPIDGKWLKQSLDEAGIRWRVIVLSACYSGGLIDDLKSPTTVIITAAAADRASFGCTNEADLTYFGRAFFAEGFRNANDLQGVFLSAKRRVSEKEALMGFPASNPQMVVGELMKTALPAFEKALFEGGGQQKSGE